LQRHPNPVQPVIANGGTDKEAKAAKKEKHHKHHHHRE
jgi:hypothetical protein